MKLSVTIKFAFFLSVNMAYEAGFFSDKLWSVAIFADSDTTQLFNYNCQESNMPSLEDFHQVSIENIQLLLKVTGCMIVVASIVHLSTFRCFRVYVLNNITLVFAWIAMALLNITHLVIIIFKQAYNFILG